VAAAARHMVVVAVPTVVVAARHTVGEVADRTAAVTKLSKQNFSKSPLLQTRRGLFFDNRLPLLPF